MSKWLAAFFLVVSASRAVAQDQDPTELKKRILEKVSQRLAQERAALMKRIEKIIDEELAKEQPAAKGPQADPVREAEKKLRAAEEEKERAAAELAKAKRDAEDEPIRKEAKQDGPHDEDEAQELFDRALKLHDDQKSYKESIHLFKRIYFQFPKSSVGFTSAYNVACGYALLGQKEEAIDWLETSIKAGFSKIDHLRKDPDLDNLRNERRYKKLLADR